MSMLWTVRYYLLCLKILNKPSGTDRNAPNNGGMKYGIRVLSNAKKAAQFNQDNGNKLWANTIMK